MFDLYVSYDCGVHYCLECSAPTVEEMQPKLDELDKSYLRWYLNKDGQDYFEEMCGIHKGIISLINKIGMSYKGEETAMKCMVCGTELVRREDGLLECPNPDCPSKRGWIKIR